MMSGILTLSLFLYKHWLTMLDKADSVIRDINSTMNISTKILKSDVSRSTIATVPSYLNRYVEVLICYKTAYLLLHIR